MCYTLLAVVLLLAVLVGWWATKEVPEGYMFATLIPLIQGSLPQTVFGSLVPPLTPPVPDDMVPMPRPDNERFVTLPSTGDRMPAIGLGMCCRASAYDDESVRRSVLWFLLQGGRHIDTAHLYMNHKPIGVAIQQAIARGVPREEIFLVTKVFDRAYAQGREHVEGLLHRYAEELQVGDFVMRFGFSPHNMIQYATLTFVCRCASHDVLLLHIAFVFPFHVSACRLSTSTWF